MRWSGWCRALWASLAVTVPLGAQALYPPLKPAWQAKAAPAVANGVSGFYAAPTVVGEIVYATDVAGGVHAYSLADGKALWTLPTTEPCYSGLAVAGALGYAAVGKELVAVDLTTGTAQWKHPLDGVVYATPVVADGVVLVGTGDTGTVYALDAATGAERWTFPLGARMGSGLTVADGMVYVGSYDRHLYAIDLPTARLKWQFVGETIIDSMLLAADGRVYLKLTNDAVAALDAATGKPVWRGKALLPSVSDAPTSWSPLARAGDNLLTALSDGRLLALSAATGEPVWVTAPGSTFAAPPVVAGELGFAGGKDGSLAALDLASGESVWSWQPPQTSAIGLISGIMWPPVISGKHLLAASMDGNLYAFEGDLEGTAWKQARQAADNWRTRLGQAVAPGLKPTQAEIRALGELGQRLSGFVVWESNRDGAWDLFRIDTDGSGFARLTNFAAKRNPLAYDHYLRPRVSPDGSQVLFEYGRKGGAGESWLVPAGGGEPARQCVGEPLNWAPDGRSFYFVRGSRLWQRQLADGSERQANDVALPITGAGQGLVGSVSPDLKALAFRSPASNELFVFASGKTMKTTAGCEAQMTADGRYMFWVNRPKDFRAWDVAANREIPFLGEPASQPHNYTYFPTVTPDLRWVAYGASPNQHDHSTSDYEVYVQEMTDWQPVGPPVRLSWHGRTDRWPYLWIKP